jgi:signal transduction histidine kinase
VTSSGLRVAKYEATTVPDRGRGFMQPCRKDTLVARYGMVAVLALRVAGDRLDGRLLALDPRGRPEDLLTLGEVLAHLVEADLDRFHLQERLVEAAAAEERVRLARDLHDGLLQSMTATGLQLEGVLRSLERDPVAARKRLEDLQALVAVQQADLRNFVQQLRVLPLPDSMSVPGADMRLDGLAHRVADQWGIRVELTHDNPHRPIGDDLGREIYHIVQECIANAARHGAAAEVKIRIGSRDDRIRIEVADNGRGFPFSGRHDFTALTASGIGPLSLRQRIAVLGGELVVDSGENGARLEIELPA